MTVVKSKSAHEDRAHAPLPPSASSRWLKCAPSQGYIKALIKRKTIKKRVSGPAAQRGTRIHEIAEPWLKAFIAGKGYKPPSKAAKDEVAEAAAYVDYCMKRWKHSLLLDSKATCGVEHRSVITDDCWGSCDFWIFAAKVFVSIDLKTGHEDVDPQGNTQLIIYAWGVIRERQYITRRVELCIWQPNADPQRPERDSILTMSEFTAYVRQLKEGIDEAATYLRLKTDDMSAYEDHLVPGAWCQYCDALGVCPKARAQSLAISSQQFQPVPIEKTVLPSPGTLEADQVAQILVRAPMFAAWLNAVQLRAMELMHKGHTVPGFKVVPKQTRRAWESKYTDAQIAKRLGVGVKAILETRRLSPAKVEETLTKAQKEKLAGLLFKPLGDPTVVSDTDRRQALPSTKISFEPVTTKEEEDD